jgi:hypothetical protein
MTQSSLKRLRVYRLTGDEPVFEGCAASLSELKSAVAQQLGASPDELLFVRGSSSEQATELREIDLCGHIDDAAETVTVVRDARLACVQHIVDLAEQLQAECYRTRRYVDAPLELSEAMSHKLTALAVVRQCGGDVMRYASDELRADRDLVLTSFLKDKWGIPHLAASMWEDKEVVMAAMIAAPDHTYYMLSRLSDELKSDYDVVLAAVRGEGVAIVHASTHLRANRQIVLAAVTQYGRVLEMVSDVFRTDRDVVMAAVQQDGVVLRMASEELRADPDVVRAAILQCGDALEYASAQLRSDRRFVLTAVMKAGRALKWAAAAQLQDDRDLVIIAVTEEGAALEFASKRLQADRAVVLAALAPQLHAGFTYGSNYRPLEYVSPELQKDRAIVLAAVMKHGHALKYASAEFRDDRDIVLVAVRNTGFALQHASDALRSDPVVIAAATKTSPCIVQYANLLMKEKM